MVAFARDAKGNITGGQQILLDSKTNNKADVDIAKRSFGKIAGSFVNVGSVSNCNINSELNSHSNRAITNINTNSNTDIRTSVKVAAMSHHI